MFDKIKKLLRHPADEPEDITVLDGPGSYMVYFEGVVTAIADEAYILTVKLDEKYAENLGETQYRVQIECVGGGMEKFKTGDHIWVSFPGGMELSKTPKLVKCSDNNTGLAEN